MLIGIVHFIIINSKKNKYHTYLKGTFLNPLPRICFIDFREGGERERGREGEKSM